MSESNHRPVKTNSAFGATKDHGQNFIVQAIQGVRGWIRAGGDSLGASTYARMEEGLRRWAREVGALLDPDLVLPHFREAIFAKCTCPRFD